MADLKEDYYFKCVPEREQAAGSNIDWKAYNAIISIVLSYSTVEARLSKFLARWDLFPSAFNLLSILFRTNGQGMHLSRISELLAVSRANVTGLVDVLARKKLVQRVASEKDRRVRLARLTPEGLRLIQEILPAYYEFNRGLCDSVSDADMETLSRVLSQLRTTMAPAEYTPGEATAPK
jgi:DNA-binding MarR family transcriptional regulator